MVMKSYWKNKKLWILLLAVILFIIRYFPFIIFIIWFCSALPFEDGAVPDPPISKSIAESKSRGAFVCEYSRDSIIILDSIRIKIDEAFAEHHCCYVGYTDSIRFLPTRYNIIIVFNSKDSWSYHKLNTRSAIWKGLENYYSKDTIQWAMDNKFQHTLLSDEEIYYYADSLPPKDLNIYIEQLTLYTKECVKDCVDTIIWDVKRDTLGCLNLSRME